MKREIEAPRGGGSAAGEQTISKYRHGAGKIFAKQKRKIQCNFTEADVEREEREQQRSLKEAGLLDEISGAWKESPVQHFFSASELEAWEENWPKGDGRPVAKIIYDPAAGEVRVSGRFPGKFFFGRTFRLERDGLALTLQQVREFVREQTKR
jgi:hypothetical protein